MMLNNTDLTQGLRTRSSNILRTPSMHMTPMDENSMSLRRSKKNGKGLSESRSKSSVKIKSSSAIRTRRAFGDISNQDSSRTNYSGNPNSAFPKKTSVSLTLKKPKSVSFQSEKSGKIRSQKIKSKSRESLRELKAKTPKSITKTPKSKAAFEIPTDASLRFESMQKQVNTRKNLKNSASTKKNRISAKPSEPYEDIERSAGRMWHEDVSDDEHERSFDLEGCTDFIPHAKYMEAVKRDEQRSKRMSEQYQRDIEAGLKQEEADFHAALNLIDDLEIFVNEDVELPNEEIGIDEGINDLMFDLDDMSI